MQTSTHALPGLVSMLAIVHLMAGVATAGVPITVDVERPQRTLDTVTFTTFEIHVTNASEDTLRVRAVRVLNDLPDSSWSSSICSMTICYPPEVDTTAYELSRPRTMTGFTVHVMTGHRHGDTARIAIAIDIGPDGDPIVRELVMVTAQPPPQLFRVEPTAHEVDVTVGDTAEIVTWVYNHAGDTLTMSVERVEEYYTSAGWQSALCVMENCAPPEVDRPSPIVLDVDRAVNFTLRVAAGAPGQGRIVLRFNTSRGTDPIERRFTVNAGLSSVPRSLPYRALTYPNPAVDVVRLSLGQLSAGAHYSLIVAGADGRIVRRARIDPSSVDVDGTLALDVSNLVPGTYLFNITGIAGEVAGRFTIER